MGEPANPRAPMAIPPSTFVAVRRSTARSVVRLGLLFSLSIVLCLLVYELFLGAPLTPVSMALTVVVCMLIALATPWKIVVRVGPEGVWLRGGIIPSAHFIPCARIARVDVDGTLVWISRDDGKRIGLGFPRRQPHLATELATRIGEIVSAHRTIQHPFGALLGRGGRSFETWWRALAGRSPDAAYRDIAIPKAELLETIEDVDAPADVRLGAAVVLRRIGLDDLCRARVRVASQLTRDPKLRIGLDRAAADDEEAIERAVDAFASRGAS